MLAMAYRDVFVAQIAFGAKDAQTVKALREAESYRGASLVIAYSHCIAHGYRMRDGLTQQKLAVSSGYWPLYRFDPRRAEDGGVAMQLDSKPPKTPLSEFAYGEARYRMLKKRDPVRAKELMALAEEDVARRYASYEALTRTET